MRLTLFSQRSLLLVVGSGSWCCRLTSLLLCAGSAASGVESCARREGLGASVCGCSMVLSAGGGVAVGVVVVSRLVLWRAFAALASALRSVAASASPSAI